MTSLSEAVPIERLRNIGIAAHIDAGKTTLSERILVLTGKERRVGRVDEGTATLDWMEEERERGITIAAAATCVDWEGHRIQLIDTPGHVDFTIEVERCMRVLDGGVLLLDAIEAVQAQTDTVWRQMAKRELPVLGFVNKCERPGADFLGVAERVRDRLGAKAYPVQYPVELDERLVGVADLLSLRMTVLENGRELPGQPIPEQVLDEVQVLRMELLERLARYDDGLLEAAYGEAELDLERAYGALRHAVLARKFVPLFAGSALKGLGVRALLDGVVRYLPSPQDRPPVQGFEPDGEEDGPSLLRTADESGPLCAFAFKLAGDDHGETTWVRIYSGTLKDGTALYSPRLAQAFQVHEIRRMHAAHFERIDQAGPGDIVALRGLSGVATGDTLCAQDAPILLESMRVPVPVIARVLEPQSGEERDRLREALRRPAFDPRRPGPAGPRAAHHRAIRGGGDGVPAPRNPDRPIDQAVWLGAAGRGAPGFLPGMRAERGLWASRGSGGGGGARAPRVRGPAHRPRSGSRRASRPTRRGLGPRTGARPRVGGDPAGWVGHGAAPGIPPAGDPMHRGASAIRAGWAGWGGWAGLGRPARLGSSPGAGRGGLAGAGRAARNSDP